MNLLDLLDAVKEQNLPLQRLEMLHDEMTHLFSEYQMEMGELKKAEAIFIFEQTHRADMKVTNALANTNWRVTEKGQRMIEVDASLRALQKELSGLKHKLFSTL